MDIDDDSDLTPYESGDEDYAPGPSASTANRNANGSGSAAKGGSKGGAGESGYLIRNTLKPPRATTYSAKALFEAIGNGDISLEAEYQRGTRPTPFSHRSSLTASSSSPLLSSLSPFSSLFCCDDTVNLDLWEPSPLRNRTQNDAPKPNYPQRAHVHTTAYNRVSIHFPRLVVYDDICCCSSAVSAIQTHCAHSLRGPVSPVLCLPLLLFLRCSYAAVLLFSSRLRLSPASRLSAALSLTVQRSSLSHPYNAPLSLTVQSSSLLPGLADVVWPDTKQIGLIDSIFRNFYVPPIIFATKTWEDGSETKICIDGKQRLTSVRRFMEGWIPHKDPTNAQKWYYMDNAAVKGSRNRKNILPVKLQRMFENKQVVCVEYQDITDSDEREIFQRVQLGMALTPAEKLQIISTPRAALTRALVQRYITNGPLNPSSLDWDGTRAADFRCVASALWCLARWGFGCSEGVGKVRRDLVVDDDEGDGGEGGGMGRALTTVPTMPQLDRWLSVEGEVGEAFRRRGEEAFRIFGEVVGDRKLGRVATLTSSLSSASSSSSDDDTNGQTKVKKEREDEGGGRAVDKGKGRKDVPTKVSPLEFVFCVVLVGVWKDKMGKEELARWIGKMRRDVRERHVDVRLNSKVGKTMIEFMRGIKPGLGKGKGGGEVDEEEEEEVVDAVRGKGKAKGKGKKEKGTKAKAGKETKKRKRGGDSDDEEDEDMDVDADTEDGDDGGEYSVATKKKKVKATPSNKPSTSSSTPSTLIPPPLPSSSSKKTNQSSTSSLPSRKPTLEQPPSSSTRISALKAKSAPQRLGSGTGSGMPPPLPSSSGSPRVAASLPSFKKTPSVLAAPSALSAVGGTPSANGSVSESRSGDGIPNGFHPAIFSGSTTLRPSSESASASSTETEPTPVPNSVSVPASWEHSAYQAQVQAAAVHGMVVPSLTQGSTTTTTTTSVGGYPSMTSGVYVYGGAAAAPLPAPGVPSLPSRPSESTISSASEGGHGRRGSGSGSGSRSPRLERVASPRVERGGVGSGHGRRDSRDGGRDSRDQGKRDGREGEKNANNAPLNGNRWPALASAGGGSGTYREYASGAQNGSGSEGWSRR